MKPDDLTTTAQPPPLPSTQLPSGEVSPVSPPTSETDVAPPFRPPVPAAPRPPAPRSRPIFPEVGEHIDDFELLRTLGEGSFGQVFLARQTSLDRIVALKVNPNRGSEARTLASLEHPHIVQVFSETVIADQNLRLLCMQYVPGTTLSHVIYALSRRPRGEWNGQAILDVADRQCPWPAPFHPAALRDRQLLEEADHIEAVCRLGVRLAEALDYAHDRGILHRDIKPANILLHQFGRPLLADFNLALPPPLGEGGSGMFGGTLLYMAPEHIDAFNPSEETGPEAVDRRSDLYGLGVVLFELLIGRRPFEQDSPRSMSPQLLREMAARRRAGPPSARRVQPEVPEGLDRVLRRCMDPVPARRYQTGAELARALEGARQLQQNVRDLEPCGRLTRAVCQHPFRWLALLAVLPQVAGSLVNICYNSLEIQFEGAQRSAFAVMMIVYNLVVYPLCLSVLVQRVLPVYFTWRALAAGDPLDAALVSRHRRQLTNWPIWGVGVACAGWLPGGLIFPLGISLISGSWVPPSVFGHFLISFGVAGLIAVTYSYFAVQFVALRAFYPAMWVDEPEPRQLARVELQHLERRLTLFQLLAGVIPLGAAVLLVAAGPEESGSIMYRLLTVVLILLGIAGFGLALSVAGILRRTRDVLTGAR